MGDNEVYEGVILNDEDEEGEDAAFEHHEGGDDVDQVDVPIWGPDGEMNQPTPTQPRREYHPKSDNQARNPVIDHDELKADHLEMEHDFDELHDGDIGGLHDDFDGGVKHLE